MSDEPEMNWTLEVIVVPVSDLDRSIVFYRDLLGFDVDHDTDLGEGRRIVQLTPPGSGCSIVFGMGGVVVEREPGSIKGLQLVVPDIERADRILTDRGVETSGIQVLGENPDPTGHRLDNVGVIGRPTHASIAAEQLLATMEANRTLALGAEHCDPRDIEFASRVDYFDFAMEVIADDLGLRLETR